MNLPDIDLGALTIPVFATIWAAGWLSSQLIQVKPLKDRLEKLETKQDAIDQAKDEEIRMLRQKAYG